MSRCISTKKRLVKKDLKFNSFLVNIFINRVLKNGKKELARKIVYKTFQLIKLKTHSNSLKIFETATRNVSPKFFVKILHIKFKKRPFKITNQIPILLSKFRSINLGISWIVKCAQKRSGKNIIAKLVNEILDASKRSGSGAIKKKDEIHKLAALNYK